MQNSAVSEISASAVKVRSPSARVTSLDIVRGIAMILMALDHVRVYSGVPAGGATFRRLLYAVDHELCGAGICVSRRDLCLSLQPEVCQSVVALEILAIRGVWLIFLELDVSANRLDLQL